MVLGVIGYRPWLLLAAILVAACAPWEPAPVEDRRESPRTTRPAPAPMPAPANYEIRRGDTLYSIAFRYGLDWRDIASWNRLSAPFTIRPGQSLRMTAPPRPVKPSERPAVSSTPPIARPTPDSAPTTDETRSPQAPPERSSSSAPAPSASSDSPTRTVAGVAWRWPTDGGVVRPFDASAARRGIGISGQAGQRVVASAGGEVVYSGTALIGYGELIIIKHSSQLLSAYGHNRRRLVDEGVRVQAGQPIAEMGLDETDQAILHFEIRRNGQPENPLGFLPSR